MRNRRYYRGQLPNSSPGEYTASAKLAERVSDELSIVVVHHRSLMIEVTPVI